MIKVLKEEVEKKFGKRVENRGDCELISDGILEILDKTISYNTLRRLYGLAPYSKPNMNTLNTLAEFIGYNNYLHFTKNFNYKEKASLFQKTYKYLYDENEKQIIKLVKKTKKSTEDYIGFLTFLVRELFRDKNFDLINRIFLLNEVDYHQFSYDELIYLGNSLGLVLRKEKKVPQELRKNINFRNCVFLTFVDYSCLNSYYGDWAKSLMLSKNTSEVKLFSRAVLEFRNFLNLKKVKAIKIDTIYSDEIHPILCSRLLALYFLSKKNTNVEDILTTYLNFFKKSTSSSDYWLELLSSSVLTKNIEVMKFLVENLKLKSEFFYQREHLNSYYFMCAFYYKLTNNKQKEIENMNRFNIEECRFSYEDYICMFYLIYLYHSNKSSSRKKILKKKYLELSKKLNYPYFSEDLLLNYFG